MKKPSTRLTSRRAQTSDLFVSAGSNGTITYSKADLLKEAGKPRDFYMKWIEICENHFLRRNGNYGSLFDCEGLGVTFIKGRIKTRV